MNRKIISLLCMTALLFSGCGKNASHTVPSSETLSTEDITSSSAHMIEDGMNDLSDTDITITYDTTNKTFGTSDLSQDLLYTAYTEPKITVEGNEEASKAIADVFSKHLDSFREQFLPCLLDAQESINNGADYFVPYSLEQTYSAKRCDGRILSLLCCHSEYMGGAHGNYFYTGFNFDTKTGKYLTLDDIANNKNALLRSAGDYISSQLLLPYYETKLIIPVEEAQSLIEDKILTDHNWYFTNAGLTFIANYDVFSTYAGGASFFTIPYQKLDGLNPDYQYTGAFVSSGLVGTTLSADLDSNGEADAVYYNSCYNEESGELSSILTLNGTDYSSLLNGEDCPLTQGAAAESGLEYYLIDIDPSDSYIEIAIQDNGSSGADCKTYLFRYVDFDLTYAGSIDDLIDHNSFRLKENGTFTANMRIPLVTTAYTSAEYVIDKDRLKQLEDDWYYLSADAFSKKIISCNLLQDITVYEEASRFSDKITLTSSDHPIALLATDNKDWIMVQTKDNRIFYLYLKDMSVLDSGQSLTDVLTCS